MNDPYSHRATARARGRTGYAYGRTREEADRAALIDAMDSHALEAPLRPGSSWLLGGIVAISATLLGVVVFIAH